MGPRTVERRVAVVSSAISSLNLLFDVVSGSSIEYIAGIVMIKACDLALWGFFVVASVAVAVLRFTNLRVFPQQDRGCRRVLLWPCHGKGEGERGMYTYKCGPRMG